tara:strand:- start:13 stop:405 length:393 start_codon:yes stop_codon:yes gene_type:complete
MFIFILFILHKQINQNDIKLENVSNDFSDADISEPKFSINNESKKINITATEGNFLNQDKVLLKDNVRFKSNDFSIETEEVIFNRNKQTAQSESKSVFKSKNAIIVSDGFNIHDRGNKIIFYGNSNLILK